MRIDAELVTGGVATEVQVVDAAPLINTENPTIAAATSNRQLQQLPFVFRTNNTTPISAIAVLTRGTKRDLSNEFSLSGSLPYQNEVSVDGNLTTNERAHTNPKFPEPSQSGSTRRQSQQWELRENHIFEWQHHSKDRSRRCTVHLLAKFSKATGSRCSRSSRASGPFLSHHA